MKEYNIVILGGGLAGGYAAAALVEAGLDPGELGIISAEQMLPYDRPRSQSNSCWVKKKETRC